MNNTTRYNVGFAVFGIVFVSLLLTFAPRIGGWLLLILVFGMLLAAHNHGYI